MALKFDKTTCIETNAYEFFNHLQINWFPKGFPKYYLIICFECCYGNKFS